MTTETDDRLPYERVQAWGYEEVVTLQGTRHVNYENRAVSVTVYRCPRCAALVDGEWPGGGLFDHIEWHDSQVRLTPMNNR